MLYKQYLNESRSRRLRRLCESEYTVRPETRNKFIDIIEETFEEQGNNCDLNFLDTSLITDMSRLLVILLSLTVTFLVGMFQM